ncbi:MAG: hypothetical protein H8E14_15800 [Candidatus Marinimicrobia bacterium]|nr:hypothetical protein [Candidatus Neomarinimicrobiota bacterium]
MIALILSIIACDLFNNNDDDSHDVNISLGDWKLIGSFQDKFAYKLVVHESDLFACAGRDGIWRLNIESTNPTWDYAGLADTSGVYPPLWTVTDIDIYEDTLLAACFYIRPEAVDTTIGVWRSNDYGESWMPSDYGIPQPDYEFWKFSSTWGVKRSPHNPSEVVAVGLSQYPFISHDGGYTWHTESEWFNGNNSRMYVSWHPRIAGEVWIHGQGAIFSPIVYKSTDYGIDWHGFHVELGGDTPIHSIQFDAKNNEMIYFSSEFGIIRSNDSGNELLNNSTQELSWIIEFDYGADNFGGLVTHPIHENILFFGLNTKLYWSTDAGNSFHIINSPEDSYIYSLVFSEGSDKIITQTSKGFYFIDIYDN